MNINLKRIIAVFAFLLITFLSPMYVRADVATEPNVIQISKEALQNTVTEGQNVEFSVTIENLTPQTSPQVLAPLRVEDTLPLGFMYNNNSKLFNNNDNDPNPEAIPAVSTQNGQLVTIDLAGQSTEVRDVSRINSGNSFIISYSAKAPTGITAPTNYTNQVCVYYESIVDLSEQELCTSKTFTISPISAPKASGQTKTPDAGIENREIVFAGITALFIGSGLFIFEINRKTKSSNKNQTFE